MEKKIELFTKEGTQIQNVYHTCLCSGRFRYVASLFVGYNENSPVLVQCKICKNIEEIEYWQDKSKELIEAGWKLTK